MLLRSGKGYCYEGGIRVPFLVAGWLPAGKEVFPVSSIDLFPLIMEATGIDLPEDRSIDGFSLYALEKRWKKDPNRETLVWYLLIIAMHRVPTQLSARVTIN